jgi:hypothetical protein
MLDWTMLIWLFRICKVREREGGLLMFNSLITASVYIL